MHKNRELALVQMAPIDISRDKNRNGKANEGDLKQRVLIGANQHSAHDQQLVNDASAGCPFVCDRRRVYASGRFVWVYFSLTAKYRKKPTRP